MLWLNIALGLALACAARHEYRRRNYGHARVLGTTAVLAASFTAASMAWSG
ncbi:MAG: hypothetical protein ABW202_15670 [Duganella sp.]